MTTIERHTRPEPADLFWPFEALAGLRPFADEPAIRVEERLEGDDLVVRAELPGVDPDDGVRVTVGEGALTIAAERHDHRAEGDKGRPGYRSEFHYGSLRRRLMLPPGVDADDVTATYRDGILEVRMPAKGTEPTTRSVPVARG